MGRPATGNARWNPTARRWEARITIPGQGRKPAPMADVPPCLVTPSLPPRGCTCASCAMARRVAALISKKTRNAGMVPEDASETVSEWFGRYYDAAARGEVGRKNRGRPQSSAEHRRGRFEKWIEPHLGTCSMARVTSADLRRLVQRLDDAVRERLAFYASGAAADGAKPGISSKTAQGVWSEITSGFGESVNSKRDELRVLASNPAIGVIGPVSTEEREQAALYPIEVTRLLSCTDVPRRRRRLYWAAIYTGLRRSELARVTAADVDLEHDVLVVQGKKTSAAQRHVPIEPAVRPLLEALVRVRPSGPLFDLPNSDGGKGGASDLVKRDLERAGVDRADLSRDDAQHMPFTFHGLRHTAITHWAVAGRPQAWLLVVAGHSDPSETSTYLDKASVARARFGTPHPELPANVVADILADADKHVAPAPRGRPRKSGPEFRPGLGFLALARPQKGRQNPQNRKTPERTIARADEPANVASNASIGEKTAAAAIDVGTKAPTVLAASEPSEPERWAKVEALATAVRALLCAGMVEAARPLVDELVGVASAARGQRAEVVSLAERRGREGR